MYPEIASIIYAVIFVIAAAFLFRVFEKRVGELSRRIDDRARIAGEITTTLRALEARMPEFEKRLDAVFEGAEKSTRAELAAFAGRIEMLQGRLQEFGQTFRDYQEFTRDSLEKSMEAMEKRFSGAVAREPREEAEKIRRFKDELARYEEKLNELAEKHREAAASAKRMLEQHKALSEKIANAKTDDELKELFRQSASLFQGLGRAGAVSRDLFNGGEEVLRQLLDEMSPLYKVCDICREVQDTLSICLNCGKKYCEECRGLQIGHCKACAPYYKPLHFEVRET